MLSVRIYMCIFYDYDFGAGSSHDFCPSGQKIHNSYVSSYLTSLKFLKSWRFPPKVFTEIFEDYVRKV